VVSVLLPSKFVSIPVLREGLFVLGLEIRPGVVEFKEVVPVLLTLLVFVFGSVGFEELLDGIEFEDPGGVVEPPEGSGDIGSGDVGLCCEGGVDGGGSAGAGDGGLGVVG
jgi:hypothetical protein